MLTISTVVIPQCLINVGGDLNVSAICTEVFFQPKKKTRRVFESLIFSTFDV